jgi:hypothetical protein
MLTAPSKHVRFAAGIVCAAFTAFVVLHLLWAVGLTWGLDWMSGGQSDENDLQASIALTVASLIGGTAGAAALYVTAARVGWIKTFLSDRLVQLGSWVVFAWPTIGVVNWGDSAQRTVALVVALAALVVAWPQHRPHTPRPPVSVAP